MALIKAINQKTEKKWKEAKKGEKIKWQKRRKNESACPIFVAKNVFWIRWKEFSHSRSARFFAARCTFARLTVMRINCVQCLPRTFRSTGGMEKKRNSGSQKRHWGFWQERERFDGQWNASKSVERSLGYHEIRRDHRRGKALQKKKKDNHTDV